MKRTIAESRRIEVKRLASMAVNPSDDDIQKAARLMNSFYRLCGLSYHNCMLANNYGDKIASSPATKASEEKESRWFKHLRSEFESFAGLTLTYGGIYPSIGVKNASGGFAEKINRYFYD